MGGRLPEAVLVVREAAAQGAQDAAPQVADVGVGGQDVVGCDVIVDVIVIVVVALC